MNISKMNPREHKKFGVNENTFILARSSNGDKPILVFCKEELGGEFDFFIHVEFVVEGVGGYWKPVL